MTADIGRKIKELRTKKNMTLQELSSLTDLSIGFLSQLERGLTSIAITTLDAIADVLEVDISYFFSKNKERENFITRSFEKQVFQVENARFIHYHLGNKNSEKSMLPRLIEILPGCNDEVISSYQHEGEEFVYILEGILTIFINENKYELYPGDSAHINSNMPHNWANYTNKTVKFMAVNTPNPFK